MISNTHDKLGKSTLAFLEHICYRNPAGYRWAYSCTG